jgi:hypothetical protein
MYLRVLTRPAVLLSGLSLLFALSGCNSTPTSPVPVLTTDTFTGVLGLLGTSSQAFTVNYLQGYSDAAITVTKMVTVSNATPFTGTIGIGFGQIAFDGSCTLSPTYTANTATLNQVLTASGIFQQGQYCVSIFDKGTLTEPINYTYTVQHY